VPDSPNPTVTRRHNLHALYQAFAQERLQQDPTAQGLEAAFAARIEVSPSTWSMIKKSRPIGDKLARQIESHAGKPAGWLDGDHGQLVPDEAEARFLDEARRLWRAANAKQKRELARALRSVSQPQAKPTPPSR